MSGGRYAAHVATDLLLVAQIESRAAVAALPELLALPGGPDA